nr:hypothetical protein [Tanacetum cinerariifolium]
MGLTFADTHNMIAYLTKSDASEGFEQINDFLNASVIQYALTDKIALALEIARLKKRVTKLEKKTKLKTSTLTRLRMVGTVQRVESVADTVMDDHEDPSKQVGKIAEIDADEDVTLEEVAAVYIVWA